MSGGSFDYLYAKSVTEALSSESFGLALAALVVSDCQGAREAAALMTEMARSRAVLERRWTDLSGVLHALEWWQSGDYAEDAFVEACLNYFERSKSA